MLWLIVELGFDYKFNSLSGEKNELSEALNVMFSSRPAISVKLLLKGLLGRFGFLIVSVNLLRSIFFEI